MHCAQSATKSRSTAPSGRSFVGFLCLLMTVLPAWGLDLQGHRGARGLAPENTLAAFDLALRTGVDTLELDVGITRDDVLVIAHDPSLNPTLTRDANGRWLDAPGPPIASLTLAELQRFDVGRIRPDTSYARQWTDQTPRDGERIPTLEALFALVEQRGARSVRFNIETKLTPVEPGLTRDPETFTRLLVAAIERHGLTDRTSVQSFDWRTLRAVSGLAPKIQTVALTARRPFLDNISDGRWTAGLRVAEHGDSVPRLVKAIGAAVWSPFHGDLSVESLAEAHALGLKVVPWTVNAAARMAELIDWGVDGLITDRPDRARDVLKSRNLPLPPRWPGP
jgi:glycerophosphoryl diester phosphodiesterase